jgi:trimeric autotransporter adhesin
VRRNRVARAFLPVWVLIAYSLSAAEHHGTVRFGGLPVPGVAVTATRDGQRFTAITDQQGAYSFADLPDGTWTIRVEMQCFAPLEREIGVATGAPAPEWELRALPLAEIQAAAVPAPKAPASQPAEIKAPADAPQPEPQAPEPAEEVTQTPSDGFLINGSVNNGSASPFAQAAAFGNYRLRRSLYNGSLGLIFDNSFWDARAFSLTGQNTPKPAYTHAQGLLSLAGPLKIPGLIPRNGPDVTVNYQWTRNRNATTQSALVPTLAERGGDFSQSTGAVRDPSSGQPFPGNLIPRDRISQQAAALLAFYPAPNFNEAARYNYQVPLVGSSHQDNLQTRVNKVIGRKDAISGQLAIQSNRADSTSLFGFLDTTDSLGSTASVNWMHRVTSHTFTTLGYQFSRQSVRTTPYFAGRRNVSGDAGIAGNNQDPANWGPPALTFASGIAQLSDAQDALTRNQTSGVSASLFQARGPHNLTMGADFRRQQFNQLGQQDPRGTFAFTGAAAGNDFAGFLLGTPDTSSIAFGNADKYFRASSYDAYFADDWRASASLTINAGLRWEYSSPITELRGRLVNQAVAPGFTAATPVVASDASGPLIAPDRRGFQPRVGISWRPLLASSLVVRAGYGIYYDTSIYAPIATRMAQQPPLSKTLSVQASAANPLTLADGFHAAPNAAAGTYAVDPNFRPGYVQTWQLSLQRDLPASLVMIATYLGSKGTHSQQQFLPNTWPAGAVNPCPACPAGYVYLTSNGNSTLESGKIQLRRRLHSGVSAQLTYTFSKSIDDAALGGRGQAAAVIAQDWLNLAGERGPSNFDQRHAVGFQGQYTTDVGLAGGTLLGGWKGGLLKDWTVATQITAGTGLPLTPIWFTAVAGTGVTGSVRPDYTGASLSAAPPGLFLNPAAVAAPIPGEWGNAGRNSITGPAQFVLNASLARTFRAGDRVSADFRLDSTNALNHATFTSWNVVANGAQFGLPSAANPMRSVQATVRVRF